MKMMTKAETVALDAITELGPLVSKHERTHTSSKFRKIMAYIVGGLTLVFAVLGFVLVVLNGMNWSMGMCPWCAAALGLCITLMGIKDVLGTNDASFAIFERGVAFQNKKGMTLWNWDEITSITVKQVNVVMNGVSRLERLVTLTNPHGAIHEFGNGVHDPDGATATLKRHIYSRVYPTMLEDFKAGKVVTIGTVQLDTRSGVRLGKTMLSWNELKEGVVKNGWLELIPHSGRATANHRKLLGEIPNADLVLDLLEKRLTSNQ